MKKLFLVLSATVVFAACNDADNNKSNDANSVSITGDSVTQLPDHHTAATALDYEGTYTGTVPCASCEGIETTLTLNKDKTFTLKEVYKGGKEAGTFDAKGSYEVEGNIARLQFAGGDADRSLASHVGENQLFMLDAYGNIVEGELAQNYILKKK